MPWEISIVNAADRGRPLGERDDVIARIASSLPGVVLQRPPGPPPEVLERMPSAVRAAMARTKLCADMQGDDFSIQFYANDEPAIFSVMAEVRGNGNPSPALNALCAPNGWEVIDASTGAFLDLSSGLPDEWDRFRRWRDKGIARLARGK